ncbi:hypothetical protein OS493_033903 [Desmophyllum pertusum]|uniref:Uncharacterized protein n=1 Tax=Desmophyllum pertusum TaxID=174260 RepID=A0A9W9Y8B1_9CNID|nr:hypothetical protein OS493_033903 [Desmophyllum pertusum]
MRARNFAKENHDVAENVKKGKKNYNPEVMLKNFADTTKSLGEAFEAVVKKHLQVERNIASISGDVNKARQQAGSTSFSDEAEANVACTAPVLSLVAAPMIELVSLQTKSPIRLEKFWQVALDSLQELSAQPYPLHCSVSLRP